MDAAGILLALHGRLLRAACAHQSMQFEGLGAAGRHIFRKQLITAKMKNNMIKLDYVCGFLRHANVPAADQMYEVFASVAAAATAAAAQTGPQPRP